MGITNEGLAQHLTQPSSGDLADPTLKAEVCKAKGNEEYKKRKFDVAIDFYTKGIEAKCKNEQLNAILYTNRATAHFYLGKYHDTLSDAKAARKEKPTYIKAMERGASACEKLCLYEEAITWCDAGLTIDRTNKKLLNLRIRCASGNDTSHSTAKETTPACDLGSPSSQTLDFDDATLRVIAEVYKNEGNDEFRNKDFDNAIDFYTKGLEVKCKDKELNAILHTNRATAYFCLGNYNKTLRDSKAARKLNPAYMKAVERGASACERLCLYEEAIKWCNEGLTIDRKNTALLDLRTRSLRQIEKQGDEESVNNNLQMLTAVRKNGGSNETADKLHLHIAKEAGGSAKEPDPYRNLGTIGYSLNFNEYVDYQKSQLAYAKKMNNKEGEAEAYDNLGDAYQSVGDYKQAIVYYNLELAISKELGNRVREGSTYRVLGNAYERLSDFKRAVDCHNLQLSIARETGDRRSEGNAYCNLGNVYQHLGDFKQAIDYHKLHLNISKETGDKTGEGGAYGNLGNAYQSLGEFKEAKAHHELDLAIAKEIGDRVGEGRALGNLGSALRSLGDFRKAIYHQKLRLAIAKEVGDWRGEGRAYGNLGNVYRSLGNFKQAIYYHKLHRDIAKSLGDRAGEGYACGHLGSAFYCLGDFRQAIDYHKMHLAISKDVGDRAGEGYAYGNLGISYQSLDDLEQAIHYYKLTLEITKEVRNKAGEGRIYGYLGSAYRTLHDVTRAIGFQRLRLAIANDVGDVEEVAGAYYGLGSCFEDQGALIEAQDCYETSVRHLNGIRRLLQSHDEWKIGLRDVYQFAYTSLWAVLLKRNKPLEALRAAEQGRAQALVELMESQYGFEPSQSGREDGVDFSNLGFLSSSTIFLALGSSALNTWVVTNGNRIHFSKEEVDKGNVTKSCQSFMESIKKAILAAAKCEDRSLDALRDAIYDLSVNESLIKASPESESPEIHLQILYDLIIRPVADQLCGDEVIIVPDGTLFLAPYAAFVDSNGKYLCESYRIRVLPSLTSLKLITEAPSDYHCNSGALIVGNPCTKEIRNDKGAAFLPLPAAEKEATMIAQILNTSPLIGSQATKAKVIERLNSVALIHIAAHGDIKTGEIALAPNPRRRSSTPKWEDFVLTMNDLLRLRLRARLVVLSCCHSGRGEIKAEGVVGIARAFLGAGARSVLVSLWAIDDEATLEFMTGFYQQLVHGVRASNALNQAMKCLRESKRFNDVRYWAPFVLIGDDVTLKPGGAER